MTTELTRFDLVLLFDCQDGNPNGDPDAGNMPRVDPETLQGLVSDVCQKRKVRDFVYYSHLGAEGPETGYDIFFGHSGLPGRQVLNRQIEGAHFEHMSADVREKFGKATKDEDKKKLAGATVDKARDELCRSRFDVRAFGAVLSTGLNAGQVRGPVQCTFARSIDPVLALEAAITRKSVATEKEEAEQLGRDGSITGTMGRKNFIPYGLFRSHWFVSPMLAKQTGFTTADFRVLCDALLGMWELDRSAARGLMATRALIAFKHDSALGNARSHALLDRVTVARRDAGRPPRAYSDYSLEVDRGSLPAGVQVFNLCNPEDYARLFPA